VLAIVLSLKDPGVSRKDIYVIISQLENGIIKFEELKAICEQFFTFKRENGTSHRIYEDPFTNQLVNIQSTKSGDAKKYQQRQIGRLLERRGERE
jgi:hypothetical protein